MSESRPPVPKKSKTEESDDNKTSHECLLNKSFEILGKMGEGTFGWTVYFSIATSIFFSLFRLFYFIFIFSAVYKAKNKKKNDEVVAIKRFHKVDEKQNVSVSNFKYIEA